MVRRQAAQPPCPTPKWRGDGFQILRKGRGTCSEAPEVTRLAPNRMNAILPLGPVFTPLLDSFQLHPSGTRGLDFGPGSWAINTIPLHTPHFPPPNLASARAPAQRQLSLPVRATGLRLERGRPASRDRTPLLAQKRGAESRWGEAVSRRDAHTVGGKGDAGPSNLTPFHLLAPSTCSVSSRD